MRTIGVDVGGSKATVGIVETTDGQVLETIRLETPDRAAAGARFLEDVAAAVRALADRHGRTFPVGVGLCEAIDACGEIVTAHRIGWTTAAVRQRLAFADRVSLDADVRVAALAEARFGAGSGLEHWLYINAGTGIASTIMHGSTPLVGRRGCAIGLGMSRLPEPADGRSAPVLEEISGGAAMLAAARSQGLQLASTADLIAASQDGDRRARAIVAGAGRTLGQALALLANVHDPDAIVLGGGMPAASTVYLDACRQAFADGLWRSAPIDPQICLARLGASSGLVGAAIIAAEAAGTATAGADGSRPAGS